MMDRRTVNSVQVRNGKKNNNNYYTAIINDQVLLHAD